MPEKTEEKILQLGDRIRELRERIGKTQEQCAKEMPCVKRTWERWEADGTAPKNLPGIARVLNVTLEEFMGLPALEAPVKSPFEYDPLARQAEFDRARALAEELARVLAAMSQEEPGKPTPPTTTPKGGARKKPKRQT